MTTPVDSYPATPAVRDRADPSQQVLDEAIRTAWTRIAPLWTLRSFVAVNPYSGFGDRSLGEAARAIDRFFHADALMPAEYLERRYLQGAFDEVDLERARREAQPLTPGDERCYTYSELIDLRRASNLSRVIDEELCKWCAARFDQGQAAWTQPGRDLPLWAAFVRTASHDRGPELRGIEGFRAYLRQLPESPNAAIRQILHELRVPAWMWADLLTRALATVRGWAGHVRYRVREANLRGSEDEQELIDFLAIRLAFEGAAHAARAHPEESWPRLLATHLEPEPELDQIDTRLLWQEALEHGYRRRLAARLRKGPCDRTAVGAPTLQAVFCIDVRSEVLRRHLERVSDRVQTLGFAGFFGFPVEWRPLGSEEGSARCPALIAPPHTAHQTVGAQARTTAPKATRRRLAGRARHRLAKAARLSSVSSFSFAETIGGWFGARLITDAAGLTRPRAGAAHHAERHLEPTCGHIELEARIDLAEGALRGMGLVHDFADIILLCGHGSQTTNNPYGSGLDCGACGGHAGEVNARVAAKVLEDPDVRAGLRRRGIDIPSGTRFLAGQHDTTTDAIELYETDRVAPARLETIRGWLREAGAATRAERVLRLGVDPRAGVDPAAEVRRRSRDWSEVRPEWGLARNAAFIAARRMRTRGVDLEGRAFLHDYDPEQDPDLSVLESILTAPMVVAHWINMQYYASTVDNDAFGSGNKVLHNVVGTHGVQLGNRSDLRVGLPLQSVFHGDTPYHEPIRLQAVIEAEPHHLDAVLQRSAEVAQLVDNGWVTLIAWRPGRDELLRRRPSGDWIDV